MAGVVGKVGTRPLLSEFPVLCLNDAARSLSKVLCVDMFVDVGPPILTVCAWMMIVGAVADDVGCWWAGGVLPEVAKSCGRVGMSESMIL